MDKRTHNYTLSIWRWDNPHRAPTYAMVADVACTIADWEALMAADEDVTTYPRVSVELNSDIDETHERMITLSIATAAVLLPELVAGLMCRQMES
jgi:hypothetical protein